MGSRYVWFTFDCCRLFHRLRRVVAGAKHPLHRDALVPGAKNTLTGYVEDHHMNDFQFSEQYDSFRNQGFAADPDKRGTVIAKYKPATATVARAKRPRGELDGEFWGSWAPPDTEEDELDEFGSALDAEQLAEIEKRHAEWKEQLAAERAKVAENVATALDKLERTVFHGDKLTDYQGRTYMWPPTDVKPHDHECYIPKYVCAFDRLFFFKKNTHTHTNTQTFFVFCRKHVHTWSGHTKEVNCVRFFPQYGHLLLSCSADNTIKIWDTVSHRRCLRTMYGHSKAVRDLCWNHDGSQFLSAGFDNMVRLWDTETGKVLGRFANGPMAYQARLKPDDDNLFLTAAQDKKVYQWDVRSNSVVQGRLLGGCRCHWLCVAVLAHSCFARIQRTFASCQHRDVYRQQSALRLDLRRQKAVCVGVWHSGRDQARQRSELARDSGHGRASEWPICTVCVVSSVTHSYACAPRLQMACQNLDNSVTVYECGEKFRLKGGKRFKGHSCAGYAIQIAFSPDGRFLATGDATGRALFYDWRSARCYRTLQCHDNVCMTLDWHPITPSHVATGAWRARRWHALTHVVGGWDGNIKLFD